MAWVSIGEFARLSRLSPKALRRYDESGVLPPARVDEGSGYRWYAIEQVQRARQVALLRQIGVPLAQVKAIVGLDGAAAAEQVSAYWAAAEAEHSARRDLAGYLIELLNGKRTVMYEVKIRQIPARRLLSLRCHVDADRFYAVGKGFIRRLREEGVPRPGGIAGAPFVVFHGEVDQDSDGPIQWCWPVPEEQAAQIAAGFADLALHTEGAHQHAYIQAETPHVSNAQTMALTEALLAWAEREHRHTAGAIRQILTPDPPSPGEPRPGCDWAIPLRPDGPSS